MGQQEGGGGKKLSTSTAVWITPFHILTATLLSLLLPLSFLLLARLSAAQSLSTMSLNHPQLQLSNSSFLFTLFLYTNPSLLPALVSLLSVAALIHTLFPSQKMLVTEPPKPISRPHLYAAWISLSVLQVCVCLGIEGTVVAGIDGLRFSHERSQLTRVILFLGLHETMLYWWRVVVKPVVDDTIFSYLNERWWVERVAMDVSLGGLWWWRLRDEVETLVVVVEVKRELLVGVGVADFVGWWLYYLIVTIGMVRVVKGIMWVGVLLLRFRRVETNTGESMGNEEMV